MDRARRTDALDTFVLPNSSNRTSCAPTISLFAHPPALATRHCHCSARRSDVEAPAVPRQVDQPDFWWVWPVRNSKVGPPFCMFLLFPLLIEILWLVSWPLWNVECSVFLPLVLSGWGCHYVWYHFGSIWFRSRYVRITYECLNKSYTWICDSVTYTMYKRNGSNSHPHPHPPPWQVFEKDTNKSAAEPNPNKNARKRKQSPTSSWIFLTTNLIQSAEYNRVRSIRPQIVWNLPMLNLKYGYHYFSHFGFLHWIKGIYSLRTYVKETFHFLFSLPANTFSLVLIHYFQWKKWVA
jgi:hypothetical protein